MRSALGLARCRGNGQRKIARRLGRYDTVQPQIATIGIVERIQREEALRSEQVQTMLNEKYDNVSRQDARGESVLRCNNCGSSEIHFSQKQTKSADESMTCAGRHPCTPAARARPTQRHPSSTLARSVFCLCRNCKSKWRMS